MKKITQQITQHLWDFMPIYLALAAVVAILVLIYAVQKKNIVEHGKIEKLWGCEFIKFYTGRNSEFQYIHSPKCQNH